MCKAHGDHTSMTDRVACDKTLTEEQASSNRVPGSPGLPVELGGLPQR